MIIERRVDSLTSELRCRASIKGVYTWFGARVHLDNGGNIIIPKDINISDVLIKESTISKVRLAITNCKENIIYIPNN